MYQKFFRLIMMCHFSSLYFFKINASALDVQNCGITENTSAAIQQMMTSNKTLVVLDIRNNPDVTSESLSKVRSVLRDNERGMEGKVRTNK